LTRPYFLRKITGRPRTGLFKPAGIPARELSEEVMTLDEYEAVRLADLEGLYHEQAAEHMGVSRQTFGRILETAHRKVARVLHDGKALRIEGGPVALAGQRVFGCLQCGHRWQEPFGSGRPPACPACRGPMIRRLDRGAGHGRGLGRRNRGWSGGENGEKGQDGPQAR